LYKVSDVLNSVQDFSSGFGVGVNVFAILAEKTLRFGFCFFSPQMSVISHVNFPDLQYAIKISNITKRTFTRPQMIPKTEQAMTMPKAAS